MARRIATSEQLTKAFEKARQNFGYPIPLTHTQGLECAMAAGVDVGYRNGFEDAKDQILQSVGDELLSLQKHNNNG